MAASEADRVEIVSLCIEFEKLLIPFDIDP